MKNGKKSVAKKASPAAPSVAQVIPVTLKVKLEGHEELEKLTGVASRIETAATALHIAQEAMQEGRDPHRKLLHRRVLIQVYDKDENLVSTTEHNLNIREVLQSRIGPYDISFDTVQPAISLGE